MKKHGTPFGIANPSWVKRQEKSQAKARAAKKARRKNRGKK